MYYFGKILNAFYVMFFSFILAIMIISMLLHSLYMAMIIPVVIGLFLLYIKKRRRYLPDQACLGVWYLIRACSLLLLLYVAFICKVRFSWDWGVLMTSASDYALKGEIGKQKYFARYTNNQFCLVYLSQLFKLTKFIYPGADIETFHTVSIVVSCLFVWATIGMIYRLARIVWGIRRAILAGVFATACLPFYMYAQFLYTDTPGIFLASLLLYLGIRIYQEKIRYKIILFSAFFGVTAGIVYHVKVVPFILFIAAIIAVILQKRERKEKLIILTFSLLLSIGTLSVSGNLLDNIASEQYGITAELKERWEYPLTHWVMMGLNTEINGGYNANDVKYTASFKTKEKRQDKNIEEIKKRLKNFGLNGYLGYVVCGKLPRTWGNSCFAGDDYIGRMPVNEDSLPIQFLSQYGKYHNACLIYTWAFYLVLSFGMVLSGVMAVRTKDMPDALFAGRIAMLGLALFQIIWECNSRYLITFIPLMIILSLDGYFNCKDTNLCFPHRQ